MACVISTDRPCVDSVLSKAKGMCCSLMVYSLILRSKGVSALVINFSVISSVLCFSFFFVQTGSSTRDVCGV